jgi:pimeloyl-ACP methyl ester carboxylesterase
MAATCIAVASCAGGALIEDRDCWTPTLLDAGARCGLITVPGSYGDSTRPSRLVAFAIKPPLAGSDAGNDPVVLLIGGPGLSATYYSEIDGYDDGDLDFLNEDREVILVDYRGLGESEPQADCAPSPDLSECRARLDASGLGPELRSATIVRDIDLLLDALGHQSVILYGESWGTRLALTMMRDVPERISHVILDGAFPPEVGLRDDPVAALASLDYIARTCEESSTCTEALGDVRAKLMTLGERWRDRDEAATLFAGIAAVSHFPTAPLFVHELWARDAEQAATMAARVYEWTHEVFDESTIDRAESFLMAITVICAEEAGLLDAHGPLDTSPYGLSGATLEIIRSHTFGAPVSPEEAQDLCASFAIEPAPDHEAEPVFSDIPTLVLSGGMDMDTSFAWGELTASRLAHARHLVFPFSGHVTALGEACPRSIAAQFVRDPMGPIDTGCLEADMARARELVLSTTDILAEIRRDIPASLSVN